MRFTLEPVGDVEVPDGITLGACRPGLVALTGVGALLTSPLCADGHPVADSQVAGAEPWVCGARLSAGARAGQPVQDPARQVLHAPWHLAVVTGRDAGLLAAPGRDGQVHVGRLAAVEPPGAGRVPGTLLLTDPGVSLRHALIRTAGRRWLLQDLGSANGARLGARAASRPVAWLPSRRPRLLPALTGRTRGTVRGRGRRVRVGQPIHLGSTVLEIRTVASKIDQDTQRARTSGSAAPRQAAVVWMVPVVISLTLAVLLRSPVPLLFGLTALAPALTGLFSRPRPVPAGTDLMWPDPAASAVRAAESPGNEIEARAQDARQSDAGSAGTASWWDVLRDGVALTGPRAGSLAAARALVGAAIAEPGVTVTFAVGDDSAQDWAWCRWIVDRDAGPQPRSLLVVDGADPSAVHRWHLAREPGSAVVLVHPDAARVPAWCGWLVDGSGHRRRNGVHGADSRALARGAGDSGQARAGTVPLASLQWAEEQSRRVAARESRRRRAGSRLPDRIGLLDLGIPTGAEQIAAGWAVHAGAMASLAARIGVDESGPTTIDLLADGPHALIAGTTGAGKSALLQSLVLDLAVRYPPDRLAVVLIDFKGGAGLGPCRLLPHVVGEVTDLDASLAARALDGLRSELHRREVLFRDADVTDLEGLRAHGSAPPRLLVVVDELRALRDDLPDMLPSLVRLAAQGRSLGIHLVLATQRPAGAVDAQIRANVTIRICLRVTDPAESLDVVDVPDAATLPVGLPGRAVVRRGHGAARIEQTAWAGLAPSTTTARWAPGWATTPATGADPVGTSARAGAAPQGPTPLDPVPGVVEAVRRAAEDLAPPPPLWSPPLPDVVTDADLPHRGTETRTICLGLMDLPDERTHGVATWDPARGALLVVGRAGSGRTTTLDAVIRSAQRTGATVHRILGRSAAARSSDPGAGVVTARPRPEAGAEPDGTDVDVADPRRVVRLLRLLGEAPSRSGARHLLVVDDVGGVLRLLDGLPHGPGADLLVDLVRDAARLGMAVAVAGNPSDALRLVPHAGTRLVLATADEHDDAALGVPRGLPRRDLAGRGVLLPGGHSVQVSLPGPGERAAAPGLRTPLRLEPIPEDVRLGPAHRARATQADGSSAARTDQVATPTDQPLTVVLGRGGDDAGLLTIGLGAGLLVVGPPASGRSTALATIRTGLVQPAALHDDQPRTGSAEHAVLHVLDLSDLGAPREGRAGNPASGAPGSPQQGLARRLRAWEASTVGALRVLLADDLDRHLRADPDADDLLSQWADQADGGATVPLVIATARTDRAAAIFRGTVAALRRSAPVLVLAPLTPGSADAAGGPVAVAADPALPRHPGRGVLLTHRGPVPVQVGRWDAAQDT